MSRIIIYNTKLSPELNAKVDNIQTYLNSLSATLDKDVQYQKIELDMNVKIDVPQNYQTTKLGNYADLIQDEKHFYFFIIDSSWTSKGAVNLTLSLDTVNTFSGDFTFTDKTHIIREHKNRFSNLSSLEVGENTLYAAIDNTDEGVSGAVQYKRSDETIFSGNNYLNQKWYLVYRSNDDAGIGIEIYPEKPIPLSLTSGTRTIDLSSLTLNQWQYVMLFDNDETLYVHYKDYNNNYGTKSIGEQLNAHNKIVGFRYAKTQNAPTYYLEWIVERDTDGKRSSGGVQIKELTLLHASKYRTTGVKTLDDNEIRTFGTVHNWPAIPEQGTYSKCISDVDRTSSTLVKIIELPYAPVLFEWDVNGNIILQPKTGYTQDNMLFITELDIEFGGNISNDIDLGLTSTITFGTQEAIWNLPMQNRYIPDSKLLNSAFYTYKLVYDNYSTSIALERVSQTGIDAATSINIDYKPSNTISSNVGFKISYNNGSYLEDGDYSSYILATRSLESPIYNDAYINYLRNGYNYDRKAQTAQNIVSWVGAGVQLVGGIVSTVAGAGTGGISTVAGVAMLTSGITTLATAINNTVASERNIQEKLDSARNQATTVSGCDDLNLLNWYNGNKLHIMKYRISDKLFNLMNNTFYYYGYASERYGKPLNRVRCWFDYLQCEPVFDEEQTSIYQDFLKDIKARYSAGITIFHRYNNEYNFEQTRENMEIRLVM